MTEANLFNYKEAQALHDLKEQVEFLHKKLAKLSNQVHNLRQDIKKQERRRIENGM